MIKKLKSIIKKTIGAIALFYATINAASAAAIATTGMPWESPLQKIMLSISGPVAKIIGVIVIVLAGLGIAFGESGSGVRRLFQVVIGLAIAFTATSIIASLFVVPS